MKRIVYWSVAVMILATTIIAFFLAAWLVAGFAELLRAVAGDLDAATRRLIDVGRSLRRWSRA